MNADTQRILWNTISRTESGPTRETNHCIQKQVYSEISGIINTFSGFPCGKLFFVSRDPETVLMANGEREELNLHGVGYICFFSDVTGPHQFPSPLITWHIPTVQNKIFQVPQNKALWSDPRAWWVMLARKSVLALQALDLMQDRITGLHSWRSLNLNTEMSRNRLNGSLYSKTVWNSPKVRNVRVL